MRTSFLTRAMMATMSSTALPKEAFSRPPIVSPVLCLLVDLRGRLGRIDAYRMAISSVA